MRLFNNLILAGAAHATDFQVTGCNNSTTNAAEMTISVDQAYMEQYHNALITADFDLANGEYTRTIPGSGLTVDTSDATNIYLEYRLDTADENAAGYGAAVFFPGRVTTFKCRYPRTVNVSSVYQTEDVSQYDTQIVVTFDATIYERWSDDLLDSSTAYYTAMADLYCQYFSGALQSIDAASIGAAGLQYQSCAVTSFQRTSSTARRSVENDPSYIAVSFAATYEATDGSSARSSMCTNIAPALQNALQGVVTVISPANHTPGQVNFMSLPTVTDSTCSDIEPDTFESIAIGSISYDMQAVNESRMTTVTITPEHGMTNWKANIQYCAVSYANMPDSIVYPVRNLASWSDTEVCLDPRISTTMTNANGGATIQWETFHFNDPNDPVGRSSQEHLISCNIEVSDVLFTSNPSDCTCTHSEEVCGSS